MLRCLICFNKIQDCTWHCDAMMGIDSCYDITSEHVIESMIRSGCKVAYISMLHPALIQDAAVLTIPELKVVIARSLFSDAANHLAVIGDNTLRLKNTTQTKCYTASQWLKNEDKPWEFHNDNTFNGKYCDDVVCHIGETIYKHKYSVWSSWILPQEFTFNFEDMTYAVNFEVIFDYLGYYLFRLVVGKVKNVKLNPSTYAFYTVSDADLFYSLDNTLLGLEQACIKIGFLIKSAMPLALHRGFDEKSDDKIDATIMMGLRSYVTVNGLNVQNNTPHPGMVLADMKCIDAFRRIINSHEKLKRSNKIVNLEYDGRFAWVDAFAYGAKQFFLLRWSSLSRKTVSINDIIYFNDRQANCMGNYIQSKRKRHDVYLPSNTVIRATAHKFASKNMIVYLHDEFLLSLPDIYPVTFVSNDDDYPVLMPASSPFVGWFDRVIIINDRDFQNVDYIVSITKNYTRVNIVYLDLLDVYSGEVYGTCVNEIILNFNYWRRVGHFLMCGGKSGCSCPRIEKSIMIRRKLGDFTFNNYAYCIASLIPNITLLGHSEQVRLNLNTGVMDKNIVLKDKFNYVWSKDGDNIFIDDRISTTSYNFCKYQHYGIDNGLPESIGLIRYNSSVKLTDRTITSDFKHAILVSYRGNILYLFKDNCVRSNVEIWVRDFKYIGDSIHVFRSYYTIGSVDTECLPILCVDEAKNNTITVCDWQEPEIWVKNQLPLPYGRYLDRTLENILIFNILDTNVEYADYFGKPSIIKRRFYHLKEMVDCDCGLSYHEEFEENHVCLNEIVRYPLGIAFKRKFKSPSLIRMINTNKVEYIDGVKYVTPIVNYDTHCCCGKYARTVCDNKIHGTCGDRYEFANCCPCYISKNSPPVGKASYAIKTLNGYVQVESKDANCIVRFNKKRVDSYVKFNSYLCSDCRFHTGVKCFKSLESYVRHKFEACSKNDIAILNENPLPTMYDTKEHIGPYYSAHGEHYCTETHGDVDDDYIGDVTINCHSCYPTNKFNMVEIINSAKFKIEDNYCVSEAKAKFYFDGHLVSTYDSFGKVFGLDFEENGDKYAISYYNTVKLYLNIADHEVFFSSQYQLHTVQFKDDTLSITNGDEYVCNIGTSLECTADEYWFKFYRGVDYILYKDNYYLLSRWPLYVSEPTAPLESYSDDDLIEDDLPTYIVEEYDDYILYPYPSGVCVNKIIGKPLYEHRDLNTLLQAMENRVVPFSDINSAEVSLSTAIMEYDVCEKPISVRLQDLDKIVIPYKDRWFTTGITKSKPITHSGTIGGIIVGLDTVGFEPSDLCMGDIICGKFGDMYSYIRVYKLPHWYHIITCDLTFCDVVYGGGYYYIGSTAGGLTQGDILMFKNGNIITDGCLTSGLSVYIVLRQTSAPNDLINRRDFSVSKLNTVVKHVFDCFHTKHNAQQVDDLTVFGVTDNGYSLFKNNKGFIGNFGTLKYDHQQFGNIVIADKYILCSVDNNIIADVCDIPQSGNRFFIYYDNICEPQFVIPTYNFNDKSWFKIGYVTAIGTHTSNVNKISTVDIGELRIGDIICPIECERYAYIRVSWLPYNIHIITTQLKDVTISYVSGKYIVENDSGLIKKHDVILFVNGVKVTSKTRFDLRNVYILYRESYTPTSDFGDINSVGVVVSPNIFDYDIVSLRDCVYSYNLAVLPSCFYTYTSKYALKFTIGFGIATQSDIRLPSKNNVFVRLFSKPFRYIIVVGSLDAADVAQADGYVVVINPICGFEANDVIMFADGSFIRDVNMVDNVQRVYCVYRIAPERYPLKCIYDNVINAHNGNFSVSEELELRKIGDIVGMKYIYATFGHVNKMYLLNNLFLHNTLDHKVCIVKDRVFLNDIELIQYGSVVLYLDSILLSANGKLVNDVSDVFGLNISLLVLYPLVKYRRGTLF